MSVLGNDEQYGHRGIDKSQGTVLEFTGQDAFSVDVGDFLYFQST